MLGWGRAGGGCALLCSLLLLAAAESLLQPAAVAMRKRTPSQPNAAGRAVPISASVSSTPLALTSRRAGPPRMPSRPRSLPTASSTAHGLSTTMELNSKFTTVAPCPRGSRDAQGLQRQQAACSQRPHARRTCTAVGPGASRFAYSCTPREMPGSRSVKHGRRRRRRDPPRAAAATAALCRLQVSMRLQCAVRLGLGTRT